MNDLSTATKMFWDQVASYRPRHQRKMQLVLDDLIDWTRLRPELRFVWDERVSDGKHVVKFCLKDMPVSFWAAWPREGDGARLTLLASGDPTYPGHLREFALQELSRIVGRQIGPKPQISLRALIDPGKRELVKQLMTQLFCRITGRQHNPQRVPSVRVPDRAEFHTELDARLLDAVSRGWNFIEIDAALLHFAVSCPACAKSLTICCEVMREAMLAGDQWLGSPMRWVGGPVATVRYLLPRRPPVPVSLPELSRDETQPTLPGGVAEQAPPKPALIGNSVAEPPGRVEVTVSRIIRDSEQAAQVKKAHAHRCQICGDRLELKDGSFYSEAHHVKPLGKGGPDVMENIMCVCPNHHALLDYGAIPLDPKTLRKAGHHEIAQENIDYHNREVFGA